MRVKYFNNFCSEIKKSNKYNLNFKTYIFLKYRYYVRKYDRMQNNNLAQ